MRKFLIITTLLLIVILFNSAPFTLLFETVAMGSLIIGTTIQMQRTEGVLVTFQQKFFEVFLLATLITLFAFVADKNLAMSVSKNSTTICLFATSVLALILGKEFLRYVDERRMGQPGRQILGGPMTRSENRR